MLTLPLVPRRNGTFDQSDRPIGELRLQLSGRRRGGIVHRRHAEDQLVFARVVLPAVAAERIHHARIEAFERFENADPRREPGQWAATPEEKHPRREEGGQIITHPGHGQNRGYHLHGLCQSVRHPKDSVQGSVVGGQ